MSERELRAGDFVTNGVRLLRPLAEGGMGRVWVAEHTGLRTEVVVKLMAREMAAREDGAMRFAREAEVAAAIKSPHVVQVFDHGSTDGVPYIVMELLEGKDLGAVLSERGRLEPSEAALVVAQVGKALAKAHKAGIVHRDVKPENIFLCAGEPGEGEALQVKLLDFGAAKDTCATGKQTLPGEIMGTPYYMSPEQSVGAVVDLRTDLWSLGVVAFEMLTGEKPFEGSNVGAIALAIHGPLPRISDRSRDLPLALDDWFAQACAQVPQDRFASAREMTSAFVLALTGQSPPLEQTESICLVPPRRISVRPGDADDMKKTMPTTIELVDPGSIPPPKHDSIPALVASLPDREAAHRPTRIAASLVGVAAAALMAAIVLHSPRSPETPAAAAAAPPAAAPASAVEPAPPGPVAAPVAETEDVQPPPAAAVPTPKRASAPAKKARASATAAPGKKDAGAAQGDDDLVRLIQAADAPPAP